MRNILFLLALCLSAVSLPAQFKLYEDTFAGGVVTGGYSNGATVPSGSGSFNVTIPAGSSIRRAYLIAGRVGNAPDLTITLNGSPFTFSPTNIITTGFTTIYGGNSAVHAIDVTASISAATSAYTIAVPVQSTVSDKYPEFYLYIAFNNSSLPTTNTAIFCNVLTAAPTMPWTLVTTNPVTNTNPVGLAILGGYATTGSDCESVNVNGTAVGSFGGMDFNGSSAWGSMAGFQYYNSILTGYNDDNANQPILGTDALSNIQAIIPASTSSIPVTFSHCGGGSDNHIWAVFLTWTGGAILDHGFGAVGVKREENGVAVSWEYSNSMPDDIFYIERSADMSYFETAGNLRASDKNTFNFLDDAATDAVWYRIKRVTADGAVMISETVQLSGAADKDMIISLAPNPVKAGDDVSLSLSCDDGVIYQLFSAAGGKVVRSGSLASGESVIPTTGLSAGVYLLEIKGCSGVCHTKLAIQ